MAATLPTGCDPRLVIGFSYWRDRHTADGRLPGRKALDPIELRTILPHICLYDVQAEPLRFRYRLIGTGIVARMDRDFTGRWLDEAHPHFPSSVVYADFVGVAQRALPSAYYKGPPKFQSDRHYSVLERILLPLARDGVTVDTLFAVIVTNPPTAAS